MIMGLIGPEGGGKTATLTWLVEMAHAAGQSCYAFSGYEAYFHDKDANGEIEKTWRITEPIGPKDWATLDETYNDCFIAIDEIQQFFGAEKWMGLLDRLWGFVCQQRRKRNMTIAYTTHNLMWVNNRIRQETHLAVFCKDLYWEPYWKRQGLGQGELVRLTAFDMLGLFGREGKLAFTKRLPIKQLWGCFDTYRTVSVWDGMARGILKNRQQVEIDLNAPIAAPLPADYLSDGVVDMNDYMRNEYGQVSV